MQQPPQDHNQQQSIQFTNQQVQQHQLQQQPMVICPVQFVYHDARPDEPQVQQTQQFQNQTFLINVQNTPPWIQNRTNQIIYMPQINQMQMTNNMQPYITQNMVQNPMYIQQFQQPMMIQQEQLRAMQIPNILQQNTVQNTQIRLPIDRTQEKMPLLTQMLQTQGIRKPNQNELIQTQIRPQYHMRPQMITVNPMPNQNHTCTHNKIAIPNINQVPNVIPYISQASSGTQTTKPIPQTPKNIPQVPVGTQTAKPIQPVGTQTLKQQQPVNTQTSRTSQPVNIPTTVAAHIPVQTMPSNHGPAHIPVQAIPSNHLAAHIPIQAVPSNHVPAHIPVQPVPSNHAQIPQVHIPGSVSSAMSPNVLSNMVNVIAQVASNSPKEQTIIHQNEVPQFIRNQIPEGLSVKTINRPVSNMIRPDFNTMQHLQQNIPTSSGIQRPQVRNINSNTRPYTGYKRKIQEHNDKQETDVAAFKKYCRSMPNVELDREKATRANVDQDKSQKNSSGTQVEEKLIRNTVFVQARGRVSGERNTNLVDTGSQYENNSQNDINIRNERCDRNDIRDQINRSNQFDNSNNVAKSSNQIENNTTTQNDKSNNINNCKDNQIVNTSNLIESINPIENECKNNNGSNLCSNSIDNSSNQINSESNQYSNSNIQIENTSTQHDLGESSQVEVPKVEVDIEIKREMDSPAQVVPEIVTDNSQIDVPETDTRMGVDDDDEKLSDLRKKIMINGNVYLKQRNTVEKFILTHVLDGHVIQESNVPFMIHKPTRTSPKKLTNNKEGQSIPSIKETEKREVTKRSVNDTLIANNDILVKQEVKLVKEETLVKKEDTVSINVEKTVECKNEIKIETKMDVEQKSSTTMKVQEAKANEDDPFENVCRTTVKSWTVSDLSSHLMFHKWRETAQMLREEEIDGESLLLVNKDQLLKVGINERHAEVLNDFLERTQ